MTKRIWLALALLSCCFFTGFAQVPSLWIRYFTREDGLTSSAITNVTQDSTGFIWIATRDGLYKYDGYAFTGYFTQPEDSTSLPSSHINYLYIDSKSKLWVATAFGICYYNKDLDNFERIADSKNYAGLTGINITQIGEDLNGNILIAHIQGIYRYALHERLFKEVVSVEKGQINHFLVDNVNRIWIGCSDNQGLIRFNPNTRESKVFLSLETEKGEFSTATVNRLAMENNRLWIALNGEGICMLNTVNGKLTRYPYLNNDDAVAINVYIDHSERVWTVDYAGLKILDNLTDSLTPYLPVKDDPHSVKVNVKGIFQDRQGNYWIYHEPGGVGIRTAPKGFNQLYNTAGYNRTASDANVSSIHEDARGHIWLGYYGGGIDVIDLQEGDTIHLRHNPKDKYSLGRGTILCIFSDSKGTMWIGSYFGGLQYYDEQSGNFVSYVNNPKDPNSIAGNDIRSITEDREGNLWIAVHSKGVDKFDRKHNRFTHYNNAQNNLSNNWPFKLLVDSKGDLWAATAWGLNHLKNGESNFTSYLFSDEDTNSLSNNMVVDLFEDTQQVLWVGTSSGLNRYNRNKDNFIRYVNLFANNYLSGILGDADGNLWISNLSGLAMINSKNGAVKNFGVIDGLISEEFNPRSCYRNKFNEFFFGGTKGVDIFNPIN
jgi:ligand-binding sensor domain-containing protein